MTARASSSVEGSRGYYVYGVVEAGTPPFDAPGMDEGHAPRMLVEGRLAALVGEISLAEFGEEALEENLARPDWLEQKVRAHEAVLEAALRVGPVLPFRFGTVYVSEEHVSEMLAREAEALAASLARVRGKREWGVKGFVDFARLAESLQTPEPTPAAAVETQTGAAYLDRRRLEQRVREGADRTTLEIASDAHARLAARAAEAALNPPPRAQPRGGQLFFNGVYLVENGREEELRQVVRELSEQYRDRGVRFGVTGPWPPYNFVEREVAG